MPRKNVLFFSFFLFVFLFALATGNASAAVKGKLAQNDTDADDNSDSTGDSFENQRPMESSNKVNKDELSNFKREMNDASKQVKDLQKQLKGLKGTEEWVATLKELLPKIENCSTKVTAAPTDDQRDFIDDCRSNNFFDTLNEIRDEFVPPQEIKNVMRDIDRQLKDLAGFKRTLGKSSSSDSLQTIENITTQITTHKNTISNSKGRDQRDAMQDFWNANFNDELNKIRAMVELPKEMKNISSDMNAVLKDASAKSMEKVYAFFGVEKTSVLEVLNTKKSTVDKINTLMAEGKYDEAMDIVQEDIHQGWHPGDARHLLGMTRETYDRLKGIKDKELKETVLGVVGPIMDGFIAGDVRDAKETMIQFTDQMRKYEKFFRPSYNRGSKGLDKNMMNAIDKVELLIQQKIEKGALKEDMSVDSEGNSNN